MTANAMGMGQAAGTAAATSVGGGSRDVVIAELQDRLLAARSILDPASAMEGLPFEQMAGETSDDWQK